MCGIAGFFDFASQSSMDEALERVRTMAATIVHRGPDDRGEWIDPQSGIALGFRRLSIIDLSSAGHQPMQSASGRYVIIFNGEVYNFEAIRRELVAAGVAPPFRGHSDTEVILAAVEAWGLQKAVRSFIGMFAFALWDRRERRLALVRDRVGVKPLYYGTCGRTLLFASELKALRAHPAFDGAIDRGSLALLMRHNYIPAPYSIYSDIHKVPPGTIVTIERDCVRDAVPYWSAQEVAERGVANPFNGSIAEAEEELDRLLRDSIRLRMIADVPLGVFLSGGVDSSTVAALMQAQSSRPVKSFTIGFHEDSFNEAEHARRVARHLGTEHTELYVTPSEARDVIPALPSIYDEPFADSSQIPTYLVSRLARRDVTVSLSGDGGDELFGGYNRYFWVRRIWSKLRFMPRPARRAAARLMTAVPPSFWDSLLPRWPAAGDKVHKLAGLVDAPDVAAIYRSLISHWREPEKLVLHADEPVTAVSDGLGTPLSGDYEHRMMLLDLITYLPDDILAKVDRASMAVSLEAREPLLDHRLIEFAWTLPLQMKIQAGEGKLLLRRVLYRYVPPALIERPKMGFGVPIDQWLRGPLREWAEDLLDSGMLRRQGFFDPAPIHRAWQDHLSGRRNLQYQLWNVLTFQSWLRDACRDSRAKPAAPDADGARVVLESGGAAL